MKSLSNGSQFKMLDDGTVHARAGVQTNCGGIAAIHVNITPYSKEKIIFQISERKGEHDEGFGFAVPASAVPPLFREAIFEGAKQAFENREINTGIKFELLDAMVHYIDARESKFKLAGYTAVECWLEDFARNGAK